MEQICVSILIITLLGVLFIAGIMEVSAISALLDGMDMLAESLERYPK